MSKALDLLRRLASGDNRGDFFISNELLKEIEAALAEPEQEPLSYEQIEAAREGNTITVHAFARAIEKAHGIGVYDE